jgi:hypothetical protein
MLYKIALRPLGMALRHRGMMLRHKGAELGLLRLRGNAIQFDILSLTSYRYYILRKYNRSLK